MCCLYKQHTFPKQATLFKISLSGRQMLGGVIRQSSILRVRGNNKACASEHYKIATLSAIITEREKMTQILVI